MISRPLCSLHLCVAATSVRCFKIVGLVMFVHKSWRAGFPSMWCLASIRKQLVDSRARKTPLSVDVWKQIRSCLHRVLSRLTCTSKFPGCLAIRNAMWSSSGQYLRVFALQTTHVLYCFEPFLASILPLMFRSILCREMLLWFPISLIIL